MLTDDIRNQIDLISDAFWSGGISNPLEVTEQITYLLFFPRLEGEYVKAFLCSRAANRQAASHLGGSASPHVNIGDIISFGTPLPPTSLQHEFARRVASVEKLKTTHRAHPAELDALFASLQHRAFRGEL